MSKIVYIYTLSDPKNGQVRYVGKTEYVDKRLHQHIRDCNKSNNHKNCWIKSVLKNGQKPIFNILDEVEKNNWQYWEIYWIAQFKSWGFNLVNSTDGGECGPIHFGDANPSKRLEVREKISKALKGKKVSDETKEKLSQYKGENHHGYGKPSWNSGIKTSEEVKIKLRELQSGENNNFYGKNHSAETKEKLRIINTGKVLSEEHKKKISEGGKGKHREPKSEIHKQILSKLKRKPILQFDLSNNFIKEWESILSASKVYGCRVGIGNCCLGKTVTSRGYIWKFKN